MPAVPLDVVQTATPLPFNVAPTPAPNFASKDMSVGTALVSKATRQEPGGEGSVTSSQAASTPARQNADVPRLKPAEAERVRPAQESASRQLAAQPAGLRLSKKPDFGTSPVYLAPRALKEVMPNTKLFAPSALYAPEVVDVQVKIDESGRVVDAFVSKRQKNVSGPLLAYQAIAAAKQWVFEPARMHGKAIACNYTIRFSFRPDRKY